MFKKHRTNSRATEERHSQVTKQPRPQPFSYHAVRAPQDRTTRVGADKSPVKRSIASLPIGKTSVRIASWLLVAIFFGYLVYLRTSPTVTAVADDVEIADSAKQTYQADAEKLLAGSMLNRSKLTLDTHGVADELKKLHPEIRYASVAAPIFGNSPTVSLTLMRPVATLHSAGQVYGLDATGHTLAARASAADLPVVVDEANVIPIPGEQFLPVSTVNSIKTIVEQASAAGLEIDTIALPKANPYEVLAHVKGKRYKVHYNLESDVLQQSGAMIATIKHLGTAEPKEYIDVRVQGKVYYK